MKKYLPAAIVTCIGLSNPVSAGAAEITFIGPGGIRAAVKQ